MSKMNLFRAAALAGALAVPMAATTSAQPNVVVGGGLVNVQVTDVIDNVTVVVQDVNVGIAAALALAANVCDVNVSVLAVQLRNGSATCQNALDDTAATISQQ